MTPSSIGPSIGPSPAAKANPSHTITLRQDGQRVRVLFGETAVADTTRAITLAEARYAPVFYIPMEDVAPGVLVPTDRRSRCPFKGEARYYTISANGRTADNAVWAYDAPYDEVAAIAGHVAFYPDRVTITVD